MLFGNFNDALNAYHQGLVSAPTSVVFCTPEEAKITNQKAIKAVKNSAAYKVQKAIAAVNASI